MYVSRWALQSEETNEIIQAHMVNGRSIKITSKSLQLYVPIFCAHCFSLLLAWYGKPVTDKILPSLVVDFFRVEDVAHDAEEREWSCDNR